MRAISAFLLTVWIRIEILWGTNGDMGLYDDRLADLSEPRRIRRSSPVTRRPIERSYPAPPPPHIRRSPNAVAAPKKRATSTKVQSLIFDRSAWTASQAKAWAKSHGYKHGKVDVTDKSIRIRQLDPKKFKTKRTVSFGRGIRAVVAREGMKMATTKKSRRPRRKAASAPKRRRKKARKVRAVQARRRRRHKRRRAGHVMEKRHQARAWHGAKRAHRDAAKKGWARRKKRGGVRRRRRRVETPAAVAAPRRRRRRRKSHETYAMEAPRRRRRHHARASSSSGAMGAGEFALAIGFAGFGYIVADGVDRLLATYNPNPAVTTTAPTDKFSSTGAGTLANALNVASKPNWKRLAAGAGMTALPAVGSAFVENPLLKSSLEGAAIGAGVSLFKTLWNNLVMPLLTPKDTSVAGLQTSRIARLYPAEIAAHINMTQSPPQMAVSSAGSGALSGGPEAGVGAPADVGPFALADLGGSAAGGILPTVQNTWGTGGSAAGGILPTAAQAMGTGAAPWGLPTAADALRAQAGMSGGNPGQPGLAWNPGPPSTPGAGPQAAPHSDPQCACLGDGDQFLGFIGDAVEQDPLYNTSGGTA